MSAYLVPLVSGALFVLVLWFVYWSAYWRGYDEAMKRVVWMKHVRRQIMEERAVQTQPIGVEERV